jgi:Tol biopolymer transport system component
VKDKLNQHVLAGFLSLVMLSAGVFSCNGNGGDDGGGDGNGSATVPAVVFIADKDTDGVNELYAALNDGASVVKLSGSMAPGFYVIDFKISPDGSRVAFRVGQGTPPFDMELYVNNITGGSPVKVSGVFLHPNGNVELLPAISPNDFDVFSWSPDGTMIAYIADQETDTIYELFISAPDGSFNFKVSGPLVMDRNVIDFEWAPDSSRIAYRADQVTDNKYELYTTTPAAFPILVEVSNVAPGGGDVVAPRFADDTAGGLNIDAFEWAPDGTLIAYIADEINDNVFELFTVPPDGLVLPTEVSAISGGSFDVSEFSWAPNSSRIAYLADQASNNVIELYTSTPDGTDNDEISAIDPIVVPGSNVFDFAWAPDSSLIAYRADQDIDGVFELYTTQPDGSTIPVKVSSLDPIAVPDGDVGTFAWAQDSSLIAYLADQEDDNIIELFNAELTSIVPLVFSTPIKIHPDFTGVQDVDKFKWAPDGSRIAYRANQDTDNIFELYSSLLDGSVNDKVSGFLEAGRNVFEFKWAPDNSRIAYTANQDSSTIIELYSSLPNGSGNGNISGTIDPDGDVTSFEYAP